MTKNYFPIPSVVSNSTIERNTNPTMAATHQESARSPASILTTSEILQSHEEAVAERKKSQDGGFHLPSFLTTIEAIGSSGSIRAQKLAANLASLEAGVSNTNNATNNTILASDRKTLETLSAIPPSQPRSNANGGSQKVGHSEPGILSYSKAAFDATSSSSHKPKHPGSVVSSIIAHGEAKFDDLNTQIIASIRQAHPGGRLIPLDTENLDVYGFCFTGHAELQMLTSVVDGTGISNYFFAPPPKRAASGEVSGRMGQKPQYEAGVITYKKIKWTIYFATWSKGFNIYQRGYVVHDLGTKGDDIVEQFVLECGTWTSTPKEQIWVFDQGFWQLDGVLYKSIMKANWADIILPEDLKEDVLNDVLGFYAAEETYRGLRIPWKRGVVFYGPPGNGKTITLKAIMKALYTPTESIPPLPIPSLYVKTLAGWGPPEFSIRSIFEKAREQSPCFLIWEDLDSIIDDSNRSFFLNELDGLEDNNGILVIGTTNHLDRLDPGIIKRPSRFDRKYLFDNPSDDERVKYVEYWRHKLGDTPIDFTDDLVKELAGLMKDFSFAYMKEAFVSTLLILAGRRNNKDGGDEWAAKFPEAIKKQIKQLREQLEAE
ncbi:hypothetical protein TWF191_001217 [Orbilia oligospora]|uniref:AAA+ ATPase domain-containing protein n=1 Tax=Orbilia oligospora TaxID=2813651 RepID=A0A7C8QZT5_ORBOL|nr:hypothetical protein TWF191_001217 [Orbilia oligospora]